MRTLPRQVVIHPGLQALTMSVLAVPVSMACPSHAGCSGAQENKLGQRFVVDAVLQCDLEKAGLTDDLAHTVNYAEVYKCAPIYPHAWPAIAHCAHAGT
jgi:hypothetical protein